MGEATPDPIFLILNQFDQTKQGQRLVGESGHDGGRRL